MPEETIRNLCLVLAHLFGRVIRRRYRPETLENLIKRSSSAIVLPPMPEGVHAVLKRHNEGIVTIFTNYCRQYAMQYSSRLGIDDTLPFSSRKVPVKNADLSSSCHSGFASTLFNRRLQICSRFAFVAISGHGESYASVEELVGSARAGMALSKRAIPSLLMIQDTELQLDAYACDFLRHGSVEVLVRDNGIRRGDCWFLLQDFDLAISTITETLERLIYSKKPLNDFEEAEFDGTDSDGEESNFHASSIDQVSNENERLLRAMKLLRETFHEKFKKVWS